MSSRLGIILLPAALLLVAVAVDWASAGSAQVSTRAVQSVGALAEPADASPADSAPTAKTAAQKGAAQKGDSAAEGKAGFSRQQVLLSSLTIFVLAIFVGFEIITKVPPTLHTPLMSGSNAISGITLVGAVIVTGSSNAGWLSSLVGMIAVLLATINVVGGFLVTHRMLAMFKKRKGN